MVGSVRYCAVLCCPHGGLLPKRMGAWVHPQPLLLLASGSCVKQSPAPSTERPTLRYSSCPEALAGCRGVPHPPCSAAGSAVRQVRCRRRRVRALAHPVLRTPCLLPGCVFYFAISSTLVGVGACASASWGANRAACRALRGRQLQATAALPQAPISPCVGFIGLKL